MMPSRHIFIEMLRDIEARLSEPLFQGVPVGATLTAFPQAMLIGRAVFAVMCYVMMLVLVRKRLATI
jgi:hypothetical protein